jgi:hypothetical protein
MNSGKKKTDNNPPYKKPWLPTKGNAERMLERLDRIARDVELAIAALEDYLGISVTGGGMKGKP